MSLASLTPQERHAIRVQHREAARYKQQVRKARQNLKRHRRMHGGPPRPLTLNGTIFNRGLVPVELPPIYPHMTLAELVAQGHLSLQGFEELSQRLARSPAFHPYCLAVIQDGRGGTRTVMVIS